MKEPKNPIIIMRKMRFYFVALFSVMALEINGQALNGHEYVDLGLSVMWATCNVGANTPEKCGDYYAWGEERTKESFTTVNCKTWNLDWENLEETFRDPLVEWGGTWRMPSEDEFRELINSCTWTWTSKNGQNGYKVTSNKNGKSIFLPAAGRRDGQSLFDNGEYGYYWSNSPHTLSKKNAYCLHFSFERHFIRFHYRRYNGFSVRGVADPE